MIRNRQLPRPHHHPSGVFRSEKALCEDSLELGPRLSMSPARNRVTPLGDIVAIPLRGAWTGNRGILHRGREIVRFHASDLWITCALEFRAAGTSSGSRTTSPGCTSTTRRSRSRPVIVPAPSAGATPTTPIGPPGRDALGGAEPSAKKINRRLHGERIFRGSHRRRSHELDWAGLPDGVFVPSTARPRLVLGARASRVDPGRLGGRRRRPRRGTATVITPPATVAALRTGYPVHVEKLPTAPTPSERVPEVP